MNIVVSRRRRGAKEREKRQMAGAWVNYEYKRDKGKYDKRIGCNGECSNGRGKGAMVSVVRGEERV